MQKFNRTLPALALATCRGRRRLTAAVLAGLAAASLSGSAFAQCDTYTITAGPATFIAGDTPAGIVGDDTVGDVALPFDVSVYGTTYFAGSTVKVGSNGFIDFGGLLDYPGFGNECLPRTTGINYGPTLYPHWDDLMTNGAAGGIFTGVSGDAPNRTFVVEWQAVYYAAPTTALNFEVQFHESSGNIDFVYNSIPNTGVSATVGAEFQNIGPSTQWSCNTAGGVTDGMSLRLSCASLLPGACCATDGTCSLVVQTNCATPSTWNGGSSCEPNPCPQPPANDNCANAEVVTVGTYSGDNSTGSTDGTATCGYENGGKKDVWFSFTAPADGLFNFDTVGSAQPDTVLALFDGCGGTQLACNDDSVGLLSRIQYSLTNGQTAYVRLASYGTAPAGGGYTLNINAIGSGACCDNTTGACNITSSTGCTGANTYLGDNTTCDPSPCGTPGACCSAAGTCTVLLSSACTGDYAGDGTVCDANTCTLGACCTGGSCSILNPLACASGGGTFQGASTTCGGPFYTLAPGATGFVDISGTGTLASTVSACDDCGETVLLPFSFSFLGNSYNDVWVCSNGFIQFGGANNTNLGNTPIPNTGAPNNFIAGLWDDLNPFSAGDIYYQLDGVSPNQTFTISWQNVPQFAYTDNNSFQIVLHEGSNNFELRYGAITNETPAGDYTIGFEDSTGTSGGSIPGADLGAGFVSYDASSVTLPNPCGAAATGACCAGATCSVTSSASCTGANTSYAGDNTVCNAPGNNTSPCCKADYNHSGTVTVQDIFDFLGGYFTQNPAADINASSSVTVQDIFDFLGAYFTGCL